MADALALPSSTALPGSARLISDQRLARLARRGDRRAFSAIYQRYHQDLYRYCQAILGNPQEAQDALQNTMVKVLAALPGESREIRLRPWLYRIAHNEAIEIVRRRRPSDLISDEAAAAPGPDQEVESRERLRGLLEDLGQLPERQRGAMVMREMAGMSFEQIGSAFETSAAVARQTVYEARSGLQQMSAGREMACAEVRRRISDGDGRIMRRRDLRAHLRGCPNCRAFRSAIAARKQDLAALAPLPAAASVGLLHGVLGGVGQGAGGGGALAAAGGGAAKGVSASVALKSAAAITAVAVAGVSGAEISGLVHLNRRGDPNVRRSQPGAEARGAAAPTAAGIGSAPDSGARVGSAADGAGVAGNDSQSLAQADGKRGGGLGAAGSAAQGATGDPPSADAAADPAPYAGSHGHPAGWHGRDGAPGQARSHGPRGVSDHAHASKPTHPIHPAHPAHPAKPPHPSTSSAAPKSSHAASGGSSRKGNPSRGSGAANGHRDQSSP